MEPISDQKPNWRGVGFGALLLSLGLVLLSAGSNNDSVDSVVNGADFSSIPESKSINEDVYFSVSNPHVEEKNVEARDDDRTAAGDDFLVEIEMHELLEHDEVLAWIRKVGLDRDSARERLLQYLPHSIVVKGDKKLMEGQIDEDASDGYVAFSITKMNVTEDRSFSYNSAFHIVMHTNGSIAAIAPTMLHLGMSNHITAMKFYPYDPSYMLIAVDVESSEDGPQYLWNWDGTKGETYIPLLNGSNNNCHDVQLSYDGHYVWGIGTGPDLLDTRIIESTGYNTRLEMVDIQYTAGAKSLNHVQLIEKDSIAIVSEKVHNAIIKVNVSSEVVHWVAGGPNGTLTLIDSSGTVWEPGSALWYGQHNAEYFGEDEYLMFDDQTVWHETASSDSEKKALNTSRLLIVRIDEFATTAEIIWEYDLGYHTNHFGDLDMLATGNLLGAGWVTSRTPDGSHPTFDAQLIEVTREDQETAWELNVIGNQTRDEKENAEFVLYDSWSVYSAERMYAKPLLYNLECCYTDDYAVEISFSSHGRFKENNKHIAHYELAIGDDIITKGSFMHDAYLRPTSVTIASNVTTKEACTKGSVRVTDRWGTTNEKEI